MTENAPKRLRALTFWRPWPVAITHAGKRVENRTWAPPKWIIGHDIALHAGKTVDEDTCADLVEMLGVERDLLPGPLGVVAVAKLLGYISVKEDGERVRFGVDADRALQEFASQFFGGPVGWVLDDVRPLAEPVFCRGAQGLWILPPDVDAAVRVQLAARAA